jgi:PAS domain-containing protein
MTDLPTTFFDMLPVPIAVTKRVEGDLNSPILFVNSEFTEQFGWTLDDIPDKNSWWQHAYPEPKYQKAVASQWELAVEDAIEEGKGFILLDVNINTKHKGVKRFRVYTEINSLLIPGYHIVALEPLPDE